VEKTKARVKINILWFATSLVAAAIGIPATFIVLSAIPGINGVSALAILGCSTAVFSAATMVTGISAFLRGPGIAVQDLVEVGGVFAIGPLLDIRQHYIPDDQFKNATRAITLLLHQLEHSDANALTKENREDLYSILSSSIERPDNTFHQEQYLDLRYAILTALTKVGDEESVRVVRDIADPMYRPRKNRLLPYSGGFYIGDVAANRWLQRVAREMLPLIRANVNSAVAQQSLLRASASELASDELLVRPAPIDLLPEDQLLRAPSGRDPAPHELLKSADKELT